MANENENPQQPPIEDIRQQRHESRTNTTFMEFIRDLCRTGGFEPVEATRAAASVLIHLEQRLTGDETRDLEAQLPVKLKEIIHEAFQPNEGNAVHKLHKAQFIQCVADDLDKKPEEAEGIIRAVFATLRSRISEGEAKDVLSQLPKDLQPLWLRPM